jgi:hypothetical protein
MAAKAAQPQTVDHACSPHTGAWLKGVLPAGLSGRRPIISTQVYRKSFRLNSTHGHEGGNIVSLVSTDCIKLYEGVQHCHNVSWAGRGGRAHSDAARVSMGFGIREQQCCRLAKEGCNAAAWLQVATTHLCVQDAFMRNQQSCFPAQCHQVWTAPLEAATIIGLLLWRTGGAYGLPALGVVLVRVSIGNLFEA